jgi:hypothetical protein
MASTAGAMVSAGAEVSCEAAGVTAIISADAAAAILV